MSLSEVLHHFEQTYNALDNVIETEKLKDDYSYLLDLLNIRATFRKPLNRLIDLHEKKKQEAIDLFHEEIISRSHQMQTLLPSQQVDNLNEYSKQKREKKEKEDKKKEKTQKKKVIKSNINNDKPEPNITN